MKNSAYVCGIPVPDNYNVTRTTIYDRIRFHPRSSRHILACSSKGTRNAEGAKNEPEDPISLSEIEENEAIMEPTGDEIKNKIDKKTRVKIPPEVLEYLETRVMKKYTWVEIRDGKLFCEVNLTVGVLKFKAGFRLIDLKVQSYNFNF